LNNKNLNQSFVIMANTATSLNQRHCPDCDEEYLDEGDYCLVCGAGIILIPLPQAPTSSIGGAGIAGVGEEENLTAYLDLFGIDFRELVERFNSSSNNQVISQDYASTLGKIDVDERFTILFNYVIRIGPLKVNSVPANFSPLSVDAIIEAPLVIADPVCCESSLNNANQVRGSIVLIERGLVSFAQKCKQAQDAGAVAIIVTQTNAKWPFVMADSAGELEGAVFQVPVCMVSQTDGELLVKWVHSKMKAAANKSSNSNSSSSTQVIFKCEELTKECSVCQDDMDVGENVLRLSCCHAFHSECIMTWLHKHNNCPMCRYEMPSVAATSAAAPHSTRHGNADESNNHRQSYFA
jgi:hypothetical protein